ncbi:unnamed protein product [Prorocentrum cordatum]|uniref:Uncharacterized protein n=1 Tax=Prorocentrum cordatum TaxID=2364126 RepID=A0ABN9US90_9DINO|nr:unnamed protein product [Polarella glacialis]
MLCDLGTSIIGGRLRSAKPRGPSAGAGAEAPRAPSQQGPRGGRTGQGWQREPRRRAFNFGPGGRLTDDTDGSKLGLRLAKPRTVHDDALMASAERAYHTMPGPRMDLVPGAALGLMVDGFRTSLLNGFYRPSHVFIGDRPTYWDHTGTHFMYWQVDEGRWAISPRTDDGEDLFQDALRGGTRGLAFEDADNPGQWSEFFGDDWVNVYLRVTRMTEFPQPVAPAPVPHSAAPERPASPERPAPRRSSGDDRRGGGGPPRGGTNEGGDILRLLKMLGHVEEVVLLRGTKKAQLVVRFSEARDSQTACDLGKALLPGRLPEALEQMDLAKFNDAVASARPASAPAAAAAAPPAEAAEPAEVAAATAAAAAAPAARPAEEAAEGKSSSAVKAKRAARADETRKQAKVRDAMKAFVSADLSDEGAPERNDDGARVALGDDSQAAHPGGDGTGKYYCGRDLGVAAIPGSDGQCGPHGGPQCPSCLRLQEAVSKAPGRRPAAKRPRRGAAAEPRAKPRA